MRSCVDLRSFRLCGARTVTRASAHDGIGRAADIILVMETHHRRDIGARWPHLLGKTFLLGHFDAGQEVPDPYRQGQGMHAHAVEIIMKCSASWMQQLEQMRQ